MNRYRPNKLFFAPAEFEFDDVQFVVGPKISVKVGDLPPPTNTAEELGGQFGQFQFAGPVTGTTTVFSPPDLSTQITQQNFIARFVSALAGAVVAGANFVPGRRIDVMPREFDTYTYNLLDERLLSLEEALALARQIYNDDESRRQRFFEEEAERERALIGMYDL